MADALIDDLLTRAVDAIERTDDDPLRARDDARALLADPHIAANPEAASVAHRALARAALELDELPEAAREARRAAKRAVEADLPVRASEAHLTLAGAEAMRGRWTSALRSLDLAESLADQSVMPRVLSTRATMSWVLGRLPEALAASDAALAALDPSESAARATALNTRAGILLQLGQFAAAGDAFAAAEVLFAEDGKVASAAEMHHYRGIALAHLGDLPVALQLFDEAEVLLVKAGKPLAGYDLFRIDHLRSARLLGEALILAERTVVALDRAEMKPMAAEARLRLSEVLLDLGKSAEAGAVARRAATMFGRQGRPLHAVICRYLEARAAADGGRIGVAVVRRAVSAAEELDSLGQDEQAEAAHLVAGRLLVAAGRPTEAEPHLARAASARKTGAALRRLRGWHAEALCRELHGDAAGVRRAAAAGLRVLDTHRAAMGATELRALAAGHGDHLADLGLRAALSGGRPDTVLEWAERFRAGSLTLPAVRPPDEARLAEALAGLRATVTESRQAILDGEDPGPMARRQAQLETEVQRLTRHTEGAPSTAPDDGPALDRLRAGLGDRVLIEVIEHRGRLSTVVVEGARTKLVQLGDSASVKSSFEALGFALRRLAVPAHRRPAVVAALREAVLASLTELDELLLVPLMHAGRVALDSGVPIVVVSTAALHGLPWAALPSFRGAPVTVAPSARLWLRASTKPWRGPPRPDRVVLAAGPDLEHAAPEVTALADRWPGAALLVGAGACSSAVAAAMEGADLAHIAAHGDFRRDNPLFSSLRLADGPLFVYDIEGLQHAPRTIVLSACDSGLHTATAGDELLGLAAALLARGTTDLLASVIPVPDEATAAFMATFHGAMAAGRSPSEARSVAAAALDHEDPAGLVTAIGFSSFGAG